MVKLLTLRCLKGLSRPQLVATVRSQMQQQREHLLSLRLRHHGILRAFDDCLGMSIDNNNFGICSHKVIGKSFSNFISQGNSWKGEALGNNLDACVNEIVYHCVYTTMLTELLSDQGTLTGGPLVLRPFLHSICEDVGALSKEKFSAVPSVQINGELTLPNIVPSLYEYVLVELLKNAIESVINKYGALYIDDVDDSIVIQLNDSSSGAGQSITVQDKGAGMTPQVLSRCMNAFFTTVRKKENPNYYYSRDFGVPFSGAGFGLIKSKVYLDFHEVKLHIKSEENIGTEICIQHL